MKIQTNITINRPINEIWLVLTDFENYPNWNPFIKSIKGQLQVGCRLNADIMEMNFKPKVLTVEENKQFSWLGNLFFKGIFDGLHSFRLQENRDGSTTLYHEEEFSGLLVTLFKKKLLSKTKDGFMEMNKALKDRVEKM